MKRQAGDGPLADSPGLVGLETESDASEEVERPRSRSIYTQPPWAIVEGRVELTRNPVKLTRKEDGPQEPVKLTKKEDRVPPKGADGPPKAKKKKGQPRVLLFPPLPAREQERADEEEWINEVKRALAVGLSDLVKADRDGYKSVEGAAPTPLNLVFRFRPPPRVDMPGCFEGFMQGLARCRQGCGAERRDLRVSTFAKTTEVIAFVALLRSRTMPRYDFDLYQV